MEFIKEYIVVFSIIGIVLSGYIISYASKNYSKVFNYGGLAVIIIANIFRLITIYKTDIGYFDIYNEKTSYIESWIYIIAIIWFVLSVYNVYFTRKCNKCGSYKYSYHGSTEVDRWLGSKNVAIKNKKHERIGSRTISVTYVKTEKNYTCKNCSNNWTEYSTKEL